MAVKKPVTKKPQVSPIWIQREKEINHRLMRGFTKAAIAREYDASPAALRAAMMKLKQRREWLDRRNKSKRAPGEYIPIGGIDD